MVMQFVKLSGQVLFIMRDEITKEIWTLIYRICFYSINDNQMIWFQYRILYKILGTRYYLKKLKIEMNSQCSFCHQYEEDLEHLFCNCDKVTQLWDNLMQWINNKIGLNFKLTNLTKLMGYLANDQHFWPFNLILMTTRKYIFWCSKNGFPLNIYFLQKEVKKTYLEQETLSRLNSRYDQFNKRWTLWKNIFVEIET